MPVVFDLVVVIPFAGYNRGDLISDPTTIAAVLASDPANVVQIMQGSGEPTPAPGGL